MRQKCTHFESLTLPAHVNAALENSQVEEDDDPLTDDGEDDFNSAQPADLTPLTGEMGDDLIKCILEMKTQYAVTLL